MKIAYLGQMADVSAENGIAKKIRSQTLAWMERGHSVRYFALQPTTCQWAGMAPLELALVKRGTLILRPHRSQNLCNEIRLWKPDVIYFRYCYHSFGFPALFREIPTIAEFNSQDLTEYTLTLSWLKRIYHRLTRVRLLQSCSAAIGVTQEIASFYAESGPTSCVIANGIELALFPSTPPPAHGQAPSLVFIGSAGAPWHGLHRVAEIGILFPEISIDVIGYSIRDWFAAVQSPCPANVQLHGHLPFTTYSALFAKASASIASMALYENSMNEACPLKVRESLALGVPVIAAFKDTDIPSNADYFLRLPNDSEPLAPWRDRIATFIEHWRTRRVPRTAIAHLDVSVKEAQRLAFMEKIVAASRHA